MVLVALATAIYKRYQYNELKEEELRELAHDGNFTLPGNVPSIPANVESGQHWRIGVDPAAKGAVQHDTDLQMISEARNNNSSGNRGSGNNGSNGSGTSSGSNNSTDGSESESDEMWDEVASMVECATPKQSDYSFQRSASKHEMRRSGSQATYRGRGALGRSNTVMSSASAASTDSWTSRYSCSTDGGRYFYDNDEDDESDKLSLRYF